MEKKKALLVLTAAFILLETALIYITRTNEIDFYIYGASIGAIQKTPASDDIVIVDVVADEDVEFRKNVADFLTLLLSTVEKPKAIGLDVYFIRPFDISSDKVKNATDRLIYAAKQLRGKNVPVIAGWNINSKEKHDPALKDIFTAVGHSSVNFDSHFIEILTKTNPAHDGTQELMPFFGVLLTQHTERRDADYPLSMNKEHNNKILFQYQKGFKAKTYRFIYNSVYTLTLKKENKYEQVSNCVELPDLSDVFGNKILLVGSFDRDHDDKSDTYGLHVMANAVHLLQNTKKLTTYEERSWVIILFILFFSALELFIFYLFMNLPKDTKKTAKRLFKAYALSVSLSSLILIAAVVMSLRFNHLFLDVSLVLFTVITAGGLYFVYTGMFEWDLIEKLKLPGFLKRIVNKRHRHKATVMYTDLKRSTALTAEIGDENAKLIISPIIDETIKIVKTSTGIFVNKMGDGTLSYFTSSVDDALNAAVSIQRWFKDFIEQYNTGRKPDEKIGLRIGLHTGFILIDGNDISGDVVNTGSRYESLANENGICLSDESFKELGEIGQVRFKCRFDKKATLKGKEGEHDIYMSDWEKIEKAREE
ncbi:MAG: CHASE2 domain-containing protein [Nitrospirae bacterium]|nr:CHASE2 domain-containing protein [Nitrospirota bacterium]